MHLSNSIQKKLRAGLVDILINSAIGWSSLMVQHPIFEYRAANPQYPEFCRVKEPWVRLKILLISNILDTEIMT